MKAQRKRPGDGYESDDLLPFPMEVNIADGAAIPRPKLTPEDQPDIHCRRIRVGRVFSVVAAERMSEPSLTAARGRAVTNVGSGCILNGWHSRRR